MNNYVYEQRRTVDIEIDKNRVLEISKKYNVYSVLVYSLFTRGFTEDEVIAILANNSAPEIKLNGSQEAAKLISEHIRQNHNIKIFADYDCDGITSGYVMYRGLCEARDLYAKKYNTTNSTRLTVKFPQRSEGYGLSMDIVKKWAEEKADLVITVDNGITKKQEVAFLQKKHIDTIITDHHEPQKKFLPENCIIVNPCYNNKEYSGLAGVAVAYIVLQAVYKELELNPPDETKFIPAVMTGIISDVMPLTLYNALYIKKGLEIINDKKNIDSIPYLYQLLISEEPKPLGITTTDIGFTLAPRINSASRLDDVRLAGALFCSNNLDIIKIADKKLKELNKKRKYYTKQASTILQDLKIPKDNRITTFNGKDFPTGIHGIIASELTKIYPDYPAYVYNINNGMCHGSVRCNNQSIDVLSIFKDMEIVEECAGHESACVLTLQEKNLDKFIKEFSKIYDTLNIVPVVKTYDATTSLAMLNDKLLQQINKIPYTPQETPIFRVPHVLVTSVIPSKNNPNHIKLKISDNTAVKNIWAWDFGTIYKNLGEPNKITIICSICQDFTYRTSIKATLRIIDMIPE